MRHHGRWKNIIFFSLTILLVFIFTTDQTNSWTWKTEELRQYRRSDGCDVPHLDPWDPSILPFIKQWSPLKCQQLQYELTTYDANGTLSFNTEQVQRLGISIECKYRCYHKKDGLDDSNAYDEWIMFETSIQLECEFVEVQCKRKTIPHSAVYSNNHNRILVQKSRINSVGSSDQTDFKPNVVIFVLDSVSHSNWKRSLPKSLKILQELYQSYIFDGMTKVGDQSFPNAVAFLTGKKESEFGDLHGYFDNHTLIWKDFKKANYKTYYAEDYPGFNLFYYLAKGFQHQPVDHYFRPFWLNVYGSYLHRSSTNLCYGNTPMHRLQLKYLSQYIEGYKDVSPIFALNWLTELGHDYMNQVAVGDGDVSEFLEKQYDNLKNSFVFVLSDHGHRFDPIRETVIGRLEERLPFYSMHIPETLRVKFPHLDGMLKQNSKLLTTFWDFYVTLRDVLEFSSTQSWDQLADNNASAFKAAETRWRTYSPRGMSLLRPIPDRTCISADVPEEYCVCNVEKEISTTDLKIKRSADVMISYINHLLKPYPQCAELLLDQIVYAYQTFSDRPNNTSSTGIHVEKYRIAVKVEPSKALFESLVSVSLMKHEHDDINVLGDVNRINRYGNQSICVHDRQELRKLCFCS